MVGWLGAQDMQLAIAEGDGASCVRAFNTAQERQIEESGGRQGGFRVNNLFERSIGIESTPWLFFSWLKVIECCFSKIWSIPSWSMGKKSRVACRDRHQSGGWGLWLRARLSAWCDCGSSQLLDTFQVPWGVGDVDGSNKWGHLMDGHRYMFFSRNLKWIWMDMNISQIHLLWCDFLVFSCFFSKYSMMIFTSARCFFFRSFTIMLSLSQHAEALCHWWWWLKPCPCRWSMPSLCHQAVSMATFGGCVNGWLGNTWNIPMNWVRLGDTWC